MLSNSLCICVYGGVPAKDGKLAIFQESTNKQAIITYLSSKNNAQWENRQADVAIWENFMGRRSIIC
jgi:hypothetical protein